MNVSCTNCGKRYVLSDDKVAGKASVKIRCKQCQSLISIDVAQASAGGQVSGSMPASRGSGALAMAAVQQPARSPWEDEATKAMPALDMTTQWHAMIGGVQQGPFDVKALMGKVAAGEVTLRTYLWKAGMGDWKRAADVSEVSAIFAGSGGAPSSSPSQANKPITRTVQPVARQDVAVANEMPSPEVTRPRGGNVADPLPGASSRQSGAFNIEPAPAPAPAPATRSGAFKAPLPEVATEPTRPAQTEQPLNDLFGDLSNSNLERVPSGVSGVHETPSQQSGQSTSGQADIDPFAALGEVSDKELPPPGEATKFFIAQAGVNKRNPPWKIALFAFSIVALPTAVLYLLSTFNVVQLPKVTRTNENGEEVQESFFSSEGVGGLKDLLTGDAKKRKEEAERRERERVAAAAAAAKARALALNTGGAGVEPDPVKAPTNPGLANDFALLDDPNKKNRGPKDRNNNPNAIASAGLKDDVAAKVVSDNIKTFNLCIEEALRRNPNLKVGSITVKLTVGQSGAVTAATIDPAQHQNSDWGACMIKAAKRIVFPGSDGETEVQVPLKLGVSM
ncbi:MAG: AgmX/PglI C-terminal domain-containing protein [Myxococcales bacterium]|nr:AgmX/PglI C-terminal domain-containing protein [Myxococcales bacterium]